MEKIRIRFPIIVEGKYDKIKVSSVAEAYIITTDGFGVFNSREKLAVIKKLAEKTPVIVLTDSDGAGKLIRSHICSSVPRDRIIQLYVPQIKGKEKRKQSESAEGYLGVEGIDSEVIRKLLLPFSDESEFAFRGVEITKTDFYEDRLTGKENSKEMRDKLCSILGLPQKMTSGALLEAVRVLYTFEEYKAAVQKINEEIFKF